MKTWDCFDTLIGRRYVHPVTIWEEVGRRIGDPNFVQKRKDAGRGAGHVYSKFYDNLPGIDPQVELDVEVDHAYPIVENMQQVKDGDIIISDMYLPTEQVEKMCRKAGLDKDVKFIVTPKGKKKGYIWNEVPKEQIELHTGDNQKTDYNSPINAGVPASLYTGCHFTEIEKAVSKGNPNLAAWMRYTRLQCPYTDSKSRQFWIDQANGNLPMLALASLELPDKPIAFTYRDSVHWQPLYEAMTGRKGRKLSSSRTMYKKATPEFRQYVEETTRDAVIVDLFGSGKRIFGFFNGNPPPTIYLAGLTRPHVQNVTGARGSKSLEKHNCSFEGPLVDWNASGPVFGDNDHPSDVATIQHQAMKIAIEATKYYPINKDTKQLRYIIDTMCRKDNFTDINTPWAQDNVIDQ